MFNFWWQQSKQYCGGWGSIVQNTGPSTILSAIRRMARMKMHFQRSHQYSSWSLRKEMFQEQWLMVLFSLHVVSLTHTHTELPCSCVLLRLSPINQAASESIQNIKRLNLFRCSVLIAYYTIITHLESLGPCEPDTHTHIFHALSLSYTHTQTQTQLSNTVTQ